MKDRFLFPYYLYTIHNNYKLSTVKRGQEVTKKSSVRIGFDQQSLSLLLPGGVTIKKGFVFTKYPIF